MRNLDKKMLQAMSNYSYIGIFFAVSIVMCWLFGRWLERRWHFEPWGQVGGLVLGVATGFRELYRVSKKAMREEQQ